MKKNIEYLKEVIEKKPAYKDILTLYLNILEEQKKTIIKDEDVSYILDSKEIIKNKLTDGLPLVERKKIKVNFAPAVELAERLSRLFKDRIENNGIKTFSNHQELLEKTFFDRDLSPLSTEKGDNIFLLISKFSIQPLAYTLAKNFAKYIDQKIWSNGYCPICGSKPNIAEIKGEQGFKYLHCSFCGYEWLHKRLACPYCENTDHETLNYFYAENEENYRVDTCEKCKHYIKTVDSRKLKEPVNLDIEDWCTIHLDFIAAGKGYQKEKSTFTFTL